MPQSRHADVPPMFVLHTNASMSRATREHFESGVIMSGAGAVLSLLLIAMYAFFPSQDALAGVRFGLGLCLFFGAVLVGCLVAARNAREHEYQCEQALQARLRIPAN